MLLILILSIRRKKIPFLSLIWYFIATDRKFRIESYAGRRIIIYII
jgi:hypothetical protein